MAAPNRTIVPASNPPPPPAEATGGNSTQDRNTIEKRWTPALARPFCAVSSFFLANYHRLKPHEGARGLNNTEAMLVIQILDHKWGEAAPFPSVGTLAKRMGISPRQVRSILQQLEGQGYIRRIARAHGGSNRIDMGGLFKALEELQAAVAKEKDEGTEGEEAA